MNIIEKTYKWNGKLSNRKSTNRIILHHAESKSCTADDIHQWHLANGWAGIGYHFFVRKDGTIYRGRPEGVIGSHAKGSNSDSIGICFEGSYMTETMNQTQINAGRELVSYLKNKYGISKVQNHKDVCSTNCPGTNFPFDAIVNGTVATAPTPAPTPAAKPSVTMASSSTYDPWVYRLQVTLNKLGYRDYEGKKLKEDGKFGTRTLSACPLLKIGAKGELVGLIQERLVKVGFSLKVDKDFGSTTKSKVKKFQANRGLEADGDIGKKTWPYFLTGKSV